MDNAGPRRRRPLLWIIPALLIGLLVWGGVWLVGAVQEAREAARFTACGGRFCQLKVALLNYHDLHGSFPPAYVAGPDGTPWHSWRTLLLPFLDQNTLYEQYRFDEPWDSPHNRQLGERLEYPSFQCYSSPGFERSPYTNYAVIVGEGTPFPGTGSTSLDQISDPDDVFLVVEVEGQNIHWMEPRDLSLNTMSFRINDPSAPSISSSHPGGAKACFVGQGCTTKFLTSAMTESDLRRHATFAQVETAGTDDE